MAFDPISILVAGVAAAGAAVHGSPLPPPIADVATNVVAASGVCGSRVGGSVSSAH